LQQVGAVLQPPRVQFAVVGELQAAPEHKHTEWS